MTRKESRIFETKKLAIMWVSCLSKPFAFITKIQLDEKGPNEIFLQSLWKLFIRTLWCTWCFSAMKSRLTPNCCVDGRFGVLGLSGLRSDTREPYFFTCCSSWLKKSTKQMLVKMKLQIFTANPFTLCAVVQLKILCRYMLHFQRKRGRSHKKGPTDQITTCL